MELIWENVFPFPDVIFLIYLYQRYIYPTDYTRVNEFGTTGEMHTGGAQGEVANGGATAVEGSEQGETTEEKGTEEKKND